MTQLLSPPGVARSYTPNRRFPALRAVKATNASHATKRVLGLWVPGEMFRKGTIFIIEAQCGTAATIVNFNVGGPGTSRAAGVNIALTASDASATNSVARVIFLQEADGLFPTLRMTGHWNGDGGSVDGPGIMVTSATTVFVQPMNFVELSTNGTFTLAFASLDIIPGPSGRGLGFQEYLDV